MTKQEVYFVAALLDADMPPVQIADAIAEPEFKQALQIFQMSQRPTESTKGSLEYIYAKKVIISTADDDDEPTSTAVLNMDAKVAMALRAFAISIVEEL